MLIFRLTLERSSHRAVNGAESQLLCIHITQQFMTVDRALLTSVYSRSAVSQHSWYTVGMLKNNRTALPGAVVYEFNNVALPYCLLR